jgi:FlaA1/EpsC-like NDP-sugar epimerase
VFDDQRVLVTGGTGSLGKTVVRRLLAGDAGRPARVTVFSRDEAKQHDMRLSYLHRESATDDVIYRHSRELLTFRIGDVRDYHQLARAVSEADIVIHAAALKQVPSCEYFPDEAVATNVLGALNLVRAIRELRLPVKVVAGVSTDKACKPINVMGMSKAIQERIVVEGNLHQDHCLMAAVRYGNVLSSRGSVIPLFKQQIAAGGPLTITLPEMTRFLLSLDRAVETIFAAFELAGRGDVLVPQIPAARIADLAAALIGDRPIETVAVGIRPGEKIHEILVSEEEAYRTVEREGYYVVQPMLPEIRNDDAARPLSGEYSSADAVVTGAELDALIEQADFVDAAMAGGARIAR